MTLASIEDLEVIFGDGTKPFVLEEADGENMDIAIALTNKDDDNLVICELCKKKFHVKKTVALVRDPQKHASFIKWELIQLFVQLMLLLELLNNKLLLMR